MLGVLVNALGVIIGSLLGLLLRRGIPERISRAVMTALGLCTLYIGISGTLQGADTLVMILALVLGTMLGTALDIDGAVQRLGAYAEKSLRSRAGNAAGPSIGEGFVTASLLFCVGSMTVVGSLNAGLTGDNSMLFAKSLLDMIASAMLTVSLGIGVMLSAAFVLVFQGAIVLLAGLIKPLLSDAAILQMSCAGSLLIVGVSINLLQLAKIKVADMMPAIALAPVLTALLALF